MAGRQADRQTGGQTDNMYTAAVDNKPVEY